MCVLVVNNRATGPPHSVFHPTTHRISIRQRKSNKYESHHKLYPNHLKNEILHWRIQCTASCWSGRLVRCTRLLKMRPKISTPFMFMLRAWFPSILEININVNNVWIFTLCTEWITQQSEHDSQAGYVIVINNYVYFAIKFTENRMVSMLFGKVLIDPSIHPSLTIRNITYLV